MRRPVSSGKLHDGRCADPHALNPEKVSRQLREIAKRIDLRIKGHPRTFVISVPDWSGIHQESGTRSICGRDTTTLVEAAASAATSPKCQFCGKNACFRGAHVPRAAVEASFHGDIRNHAALWTGRSTIGPRFQKSPKNELFSPISFDWQGVCLVACSSPTSELSIWRPAWLSTFLPR